MSLWVVRIFFLLLCTVSGYAVSQYRPEIIDGGKYGLLAGFGLAGVLISIDHMVKGFSLRAFTAATFGLFLGTILAWLVIAPSCSFSPTNPPAGSFALAFSSASVIWE